MDGLIECLKEKRTRSQWAKLLWQKAYLWRLLRREEYTWICNGAFTKRELAKALRMRLASMSQSEYAVYVKHNHSHKGWCKKEKLEKRNKKERLMIVSILTDMFDCFIEPDYLGTA